ncbi:hypothetical protein [Streptomyces parvus]|uniref:Uncharacterized protein n=1 Tax=Streptomyces parvus TaxID=66428 RepID=A0A7K3RZ53_9ACTN|nr:hypothetical protein [Streptomyces parvus]NEC20520.1 hypothetical protein [Streptomyces parvus]
MTDTPMPPDREQRIRRARTHCEALRFETEDERPLHVWGPSQYPTKEMCQRCTVMRSWAEDLDADDVVLLAEVDRLRARIVELTARPSVGYVLWCVEQSLGDEAAQHLLDLNPDLKDAG